MGPCPLPARSVGYESVPWAGVRFGASRPRRCTRLARCETLRRRRTHERRNDPSGCSDSGSFAVVRGADPSATLGVQAVDGRWMPEVAHGGPPPERPKCKCRSGNRNRRPADPRDGSSHRVPENCVSKLKCAAPDSKHSSHDRRRGARARRRRGLRPSRTHRTAHRACIAQHTGHEAWG